MKYKNGGAIRSVYISKDLNDALKRLARQINISAIFERLMWEEIAKLPAMADKDVTE